MHAVADIAVENALSFLPAHGFPALTCGDDRGWRPDRRLFAPALAGFERTSGWHDYSILLGSCTTARPATIHRAASLLRSLRGAGAQIRATFAFPPE